MIWGQLVAVPALGFWGAMLLGALLGGLGVRRLRGARPRVVGALALALALLVPISARALPFTFTNGTVADANQVNANFAALASQQGVAPAGSSNLVDLTTSLGTFCNGGSGFKVEFRVGTDGSGTAFSIPAGQTLVLTEVNVAINFNDVSLANQTIQVRVGRQGGPGFGLLDTRNVTLDGHGTGNTTVGLGSGSPFGPGSVLCIVPSGVGGAVGPGPGQLFASAHGFLTTQ
jgi:hypothetical protein